MPRFWLCCLPLSLATAFAAPNVAAANVPFAEGAHGAYEDGPGAARRITLADALHIAAKTHPSLAAHQADLAASYATSKMHLARMLPSLAVGDMLNYSHAGSKLITPGAAADVASKSPLAALPAQMGANIFYAGVRQPLLGLLPQYYDLRTAKTEAAADSDRLAHQRIALATQVRTSFAGLFRALAKQEAAKGSERALAEQVERAKAQLSAGSATEIDVLRLKSALAMAQQQRVAAESDELIERAYLLELLGLAGDERPIEFVEPGEFVAQEELTPKALLRQTALSRRADLSAAVHTAEGLRLHAKARALDLLPSIDVQLNYLNIYGRPTTGNRPSHLEANVFAAGLTASWQVWAWGATYQAHQAAKARARAARSRLEEMRRGIGREVMSRHAAVVASGSAVTLAAAQVADAEEAFRVMVATLEAKAATTTDLLDAEAAQTRARNALIDARFAAIIARLALAEALGSGAVAAPHRPAPAPLEAAEATEATDG